MEWCRVVRTFQKDEKVSMFAVLHRIIAFLEMSQTETGRDRERERERAHMCVHASPGTEQPRVDRNGSVFLFTQHSSLPLRTTLSLLP